MDAGSVSGEFRRFSAPSCCNLRSAPARFAGEGFALQIPSPSSRRCCEPRVSAPRRAQPQPCRQRLEGAGSRRSDAERSVDTVGLASHRAGERCHGGGVCGPTSLPMELQRSCACSRAAALGGLRRWNGKPR